MIGMFAVSLSGHDKGKMYVIIKEENTYLYLADGDRKTMENPKKKKKKHVQLIKKGLDEKLVKKLQNAEVIYNEEIKYAIKVKKKQEVTNVKG